MQAGKSFLKVVAKALKALDIHVIVYLIDKVGKIILCCEFADLIYWRNVIISPFFVKVTFLHYILEKM